MTLKQKIIALVITIGLILIGVFAMGIYSKNGVENQPQVISEEEKKEQPTPDANKPHLVSSNPEGLKEGVVIPADKIIEITFSHPIENRGEVKSKMDPAIKYNIELSSDKKTVKLIPEKPYELGRGFTFYITNETKFDGGLRLDNGLDFHFQTIPYKGV